MGRFSDFLRDLLPVTGRMIRENGEFINIADSIYEDITNLNHEGKVYSLSQKIVLPPSGTVWLTGETDGLGVYFFSEQYDATLGGIDIDLRENVVATGGTQLTPICRNRILNIPSTFTIFAGPTVTDIGDFLDLTGLPGPEAPQGRVPMRASDNVDWPLAPGTKYGLRIVNLNAVQKTIYAKLIWYEI